MEIIRFTFRVPKYLMSKAKILAEQNGISLNQELIELIEFGIKYFLEKTSETDTVKLDQN